LLAMNPTAIRIMIGSIIFSTIWANMAIAFLLDEYFRNLVLN